MAIAVALLSIAAAVADHEPVPWWSVPAGLVLAGFGTASITQAPSWRRCLEGLVVGGIAWAIAAIAMTSSPFDLIFGPPVAAIAVLIGQALGTIVLRILRSHAAALNALRAVGAAALAITFVPLPYALLERHATVIAEHPAGRSIDERTGGFDRVALGSTASEIERIMGPAPRWRRDQNPGPLAADGAYDGPSSLDYDGPPKDTFLRYAEAALAIRNGHVRWIQIDDRSAATSSGLGPGDSISLVKRAYPTVHCAEDSIHSEPGYIAYPYCQLRLERHRWLTFFGSYQQPGTPITAVWLTTSPLE